MGFRHCELTKQETSCLLTNTPSGALIMSVGDDMELACWGAWLCRLLRRLRSLPEPLIFKS